MDMHRLMTKTSNADCKTLLIKSWYLLVARMNYLKNPSNHFSFLLVTVITDRRAKIAFSRVDVVFEFLGF